MMAAVRVEGVSLVYGSGAAAVRALDDVDLAARPGEMIALMGPSGSGKTTLLMVMGGLLRPTAGRVELAGRDVAGWGENRLARLRLAAVGFVFQSYNLFPALTATENVMVALELKGWRGAAARAEAARLLAAVGLAHRAGGFPAQLSGGEKQRVAIARSLAGAPALLLADEPTAALDSVTGRSVMMLLRDLAHDGRAVVVVSHDPRVAELADRIVQIGDGRILGPEAAS